MAAAFWIKYMLTWVCANIANSALTMDKNFLEMPLKMCLNIVSIFFTFRWTDKLKKQIERVKRMKKNKSWLCAQWFLHGGISWDGILNNNSNLLEKLYWNGVNVDAPEMSKRIYQSLQWKYKWIHSQRHFEFGII